MVALWESYLSLFGPIRWLQVYFVLFSPSLSVFRHGIHGDKCISLWIGYLKLDLYFMTLFHLLPLGSSSNLPALPAKCSHECRILSTCLSSFVGLRLWQLRTEMACKSDCCCCPVNLNAAPVDFGDVTSLRILNCRDITAHLKINCRMSWYGPVVNFVCVRLWQLR